MKRDEINKVIKAWLLEGKNILIIGAKKKDAEYHFRQIVQTIKELQLSQPIVYTQYSVTCKEKNSVIRMTYSDRKKEELLGRPPNFFKEINVGSWGL